MKKSRFLFLSSLSVSVTCISILALSIFNLNFNPFSANLQTYGVSLDFNETLNLDESGNGEVEKRYTTFGFSYVEQYENIIQINEQGIVFNKTAINSITRMSITFNEANSVNLYYGNYFLSFENKISLSEENLVVFEEPVSFFVIQSEGVSSLTSLDIEYSCNTVYFEKSLPEIRIDTEVDEAGQPLPITSRENYVNASINITDFDNSKNNLSNAPGKVKLRGNSTYWAKKKPYRIKFDKKQGLFGNPKNKSWVLLADYMDGSSMHNFTALNFAKMVRGEEFAPFTQHVKLIVNGVDCGLYLLSDHVDEKRLNCEIDNESLLAQFDEENNFNIDNIPFMIEKDASSATDPTEIYDETYFKITTSKGNDCYYTLKYPEKENFFAVEDDETTFDSDKYYAFFNYLKTYTLDLEEKFISYGNNPSEDNLNAIKGFCDFNSLTSFGMVDLLASETDHSAKSFKMYKLAGSSLLKFGPCWDYDSCAFGLPYKGKAVVKPFDNYYTGIINRLYVGESFNRALVNNNNLDAYKALWTSFINENYETFVQMYSDEVEKISSYLVHDTDLWYDGDFSMVFDNLRYMSYYLSNKINYLNSILLVG